MLFKTSFYLSFYHFLLFFFLISFKINAQEIDTLQKISLQDAIKQALDKNFEIKILEQQKKITQTQNNWGVAGALPRVTGNLGYNFSNTNIKQEFSNGNVINNSGNNTNAINANIGVTWTLWNGNQMFFTKKRLELQTGLVQEQQNFLVQNTIFAVSENYFQILRLQQQIKNVETFIKILQTRVFLAQKSFEIGTKDKTDFLQAKIDLQEQEVLQNTQKNQIRELKTRLNRLTINNPNADFSLSDSLALPKESLEDWKILENKYEKNIQFLILNKQAEILLQNKKEVQAQNYPTVTLNANYNFVNSRNSAGFALLNQSLGPAVGVGVQIPIYNGGITRTNTQVAKINQDINQLQQEQLKINLKNELFVHYQNYQNALKNIEIEKQTIILAEENNKIAEERFKLLQINALQLRQVQLSYIQSLTRLTNAIFEVQMAVLRIKFITNN